jgi:hypothetical protein
MGRLERDVALRALGKFGISWKVRNQVAMHRELWPREGMSRLDGRIWHRTADFRAAALPAAIGGQLPSSGAGAAGCNPHRRHELAAAMASRAGRGCDMPERQMPTLARL